MCLNLKEGSLIVEVRSYCLLDRAYRMIEPLTSKVAISRDVIIDETGRWAWTENAVSTTMKQPTMELTDVVPPAERPNVNTHADDNLNLRPQRPPHSPNVRPQRSVQLPARLQDFEVYKDYMIDAAGDLVHMAFLAEMEPVSVEQALQKPQWIEAMREELKSIEKNGTWQLTELPKFKKAIPVK